jgi:hypothetical protein
MITGGFPFLGQVKNESSFDKNASMRGERVQSFSFCFSFGSSSSNSMRTKQMVDYGLCLIGFFAFLIHQPGQAGVFDVEGKEVGPSLREPSPSPSSGFPPPPSCKLVRTPGGYNFFKVTISKAGTPVVQKDLVINKWGEIWISEPGLGGSGRYPDHRQPTEDETEVITAYLKSVNFLL